MTGIFNPGPPAVSGNLVPVQDYKSRAEALDAFISSTRDDVVYLNLCRFRNN